MENPCDQAYSVLTALNREKIVATNVSVREEPGEAVLGFHWIGLRRRRPYGSFIDDGTAELTARLRNIFPKLTDVKVMIDTTSHGRRWNRIVQFRVAAEEFDSILNMQPAERSCA